jgi:hypothetical protein
MTTTYFASSMMFLLLMQVQLQASKTLPLVQDDPLLFLLVLPLPLLQQQSQLVGTTHDVWCCWDW